MNSLTIKSIQDRHFDRIGNLLFNSEENIESFVQTMKNRDNKNISTLDMIFENGSLVKYKAGGDINAPERTSVFMRFVDGAWKTLKFADGKWAF